MVPLRRFLIVQEHGHLTYPEGTPRAEVQVASQAGGDQASLLFGGMNVGAIYIVLEKFFHLSPAEPDWQVNKGGFRTSVGGSFTPELLGVGWHGDGAHRPGDRGAHPQHGLLRGLEPLLALRQGWGSRLWRALHAGEVHADPHLVLPTRYRRPRGEVLSQDLKTGFLVAPPASSSWPRSSAWSTRRWL